MAASESPHVCKMIRSDKNIFTEAVAQRCSVKKVFLEIPQNSQESPCARVSFLIKLQALEEPATLLKVALRQRLQLY